MESRDARKSGKDRKGKDRIGQDRTGQDRTGQDRTGQEGLPQQRRSLSSGASCVLSLLLSQIKENRILYLIGKTAAPRHSGLLAWPVIGTCSVCIKHTVKCMHYAFEKRQLAIHDEPFCTL